LPTFIAIDTATEALSLALQLGDERRALHRVVPRQHQQLLFGALEELLAGSRPADLGLDAIVFGRGPGSFTGLRIAASAAQGLAYSLSVPVIGVSTLETQVRTLLRRERVPDDCVLLSTIDARIGQVYAAFFHCRAGAVRALGPAVVAAPDKLQRPDGGDELRDLPCLALGSGCRLRDAFPAALAVADAGWASVLPEAEDMLDSAARRLAAGDVVEAAAALPDYVQQHSGWKTLAEQGRRA
jgi:tRNA threonylcarbamoyladenosine biosynthesis protein TsaB